MKTGIGRLDELFGGGIEEGKAALISMMPGLDGATFAEQIMLEGLKAGRKGLYFTDNKPPASVLGAVRKLNWPSKQFDRMVFVDCFSSSVGQKSGEKYWVKDANDVKALGEAVAKAARENAGGVMIFDSLSTLAGRIGEAKAADAVKEWKAALAKNKVTGIFLYTDWEAGARGGKAGRAEAGGMLARFEKEFEYVVKLQAVEEKMLLRNYFSVAKAPRRVEKAAVPFKIGLEGVALYVPKILITGPFHAGKSSFIHAVSTRAVSVDRLGTTIALDHGYIDYGGMSVDLFGTPGQERFTFMMDILNRDVFGIVLLVDSTDEASLPRAIEMLNYVKRYGIPVVVAANKQDVKGAKKPEEIRGGLQKLGFGGGVPVVGTSAATKSGCLDVVKKLIDMIVAS